MVGPSVIFPPGSSSTWGRPADWPGLPVLGASDQKFVGLYAVFNAGSNFVSLSATASAGNVNVKWGDGTADTVVGSGVKADHQYSYGAAGLDPLTTGGYKTAIITVTPVSGNLTGINLQQKHSQSGLSNYAPQWLDIAVNGSNITSIVIGGATLALSALMSAYIGNVGVLTNTSNMFYQCRSFVNVNLFNTSSVSNAVGMFRQTALVSIPSFDLSSCSDITGFARDNTAIKKTPQIITSASLLNISDMYNGCSSLVYATAFNTSGATGASNTYVNCGGLQVVEALNLQAVTSLSFFLTNAVSLQSFLPTGITRTISLSGMQLSTAALITALDNLGTAAGAQTVTITGNWGNDGSAPLVTAINGAVAKGWTVVA